MLTRCPTWVLLGSFFMSSKLLVPSRFTHQNLCCISKSKSKHEHKLDFMWSSYGFQKCMFVDSLDEFIGSFNRIYSLSNMEQWIKIWRRNPIALKHVSSWCLFFDPHLPHTKLNIRLTGHKWLVFLIRPLYLIGMWLGEDQRANIIKTHA